MTDTPRAATQPVSIQKQLLVFFRAVTTKLKLVLTMACRHIAPVLGMGGYGSDDRAGSYINTADQSNLS